MILFGVSAPSSLGVSLRKLASSAPDGIAPFVMTDEEGGVVQRMANLVESIPPAREIGATMTPAQIRRLATGLAKRMRAAGVTMDLAPVLDVDGGQGRQPGPGRHEVLQHGREDRVHWQTDWRSPLVFGQEGWCRLSGTFPGLAVRRATPT